MLKDIFESITPENLKDIPLMRDAMDIFIQYIEANCDISIDISNIFDTEKKIIREEFVKIYLDDLYRYFTKVETNQIVNDKIDYINNIYGQEAVKKDFIGELTALFNDEHFVTSKTFKQKKGTAVGIEYIYNLVETAVYGGAAESSFKFTPGEPFQFEVEGSIYRELYDQLVKPLSHPLGFTYIYMQIVKLAFEDLYQIKYKYVNKQTEVRCLEGEFDSYSDKTIIDIQILLVDSKRITKVFFEDDGVVTYLQQLLDPINVTYHNADNSVIKTYEGHCSLFLDYDLEIEVLTTDSLSDWDMESIFYDNIYNTRDVPALIGDTSLFVGSEWVVGGLGTRLITDKIEWETNIGGFIDDFNSYKEKIPVIGAPFVNIGNFFVGGKKLVKDEVVFENIISYETSIEYEGPLNPLLGMVIGSGQNIGSKVIGGIKETRYSATEEFYDLQSNIVEEFSIELL